MKDLNIFLLLLIVITSSCKDDNFDELTTEAKLEGVWNGYQIIEKYESHTSVTSDIIPTTIAFAYDNGIELLYDGTLYGRVAKNVNDLNSEFERLPGYVDTWEVINENQVRLGNLNFSIISLTESELVIQPQVNSTVTKIITLVRE